MVIDYCTLNLQSCMIHFCVRSNTLIKLMYHSFLYDKCTINYGHICPQFWFCWIAELPEFIILETGQIVFGKAYKYYMGLKCLDGVTLQSSRKNWPGTALQKDIKSYVCLVLKSINTWPKLNIGLNMSEML